MPNYFATTIGPIYKTILNAQYTRELWLSSYIFSQISKCICEELEQEDIILPKHPIDAIGYGAYPDRVIAYGDIDSDKAKSIIDNALEKFATRLGLNEEDCKRYFSIQYLLFSDNDLNAIILKEAEQNSSHIHKINACLNTLDLQSKYNAKSNDFIVKLLARDKGSSALRKAYKLAFNSEKHAFPTLQYIAAADIKDPTIKSDLNKWDDTDATDGQAQILSDERRKKIVEQLKKYHNYYAVIHADGDNFGKVISAIGNDNGKVKEFTNKLAAFIDAAKEIIDEFGGLPIYLGGDDILCFAPIKNGTKTLFHLVDELEQAFIKHFTKTEYPNLSMSYGISVSYIKYPMAEGISNSYHLLNDKAKHKDLNPNKNALALELKLHSGSTHFVNLDLATQKTAVLELFNAYKTQEELLTSIMYGFVEDEAMLLAILSNANASSRLEQYFDHKYDLKLGNPKEQFVTAIRKYFKALIEIKKPKTEADYLDIIQQTNAICRILKFTLSNDN
jgi:CRISPR-associated protein Cmr2